MPANHPECHRAAGRACSASIFALHGLFFSVALEVKAAKVDQESVSRIAKKTSVVNGPDRSN
jgi:hypothetical protein